VSAGNAAEDEVGEWLTAAGYPWQVFGAQVFDPRTPPVAGVQGVQTCVHRSSSPLRNGPDKLVAHPTYGPVLVEVVRPGRDEPTMFLSIPKLSALDAWSQVAPVIMVDALTGRAWEHLPYRWAREVVPPRAGADPYVIRRRTREQPLARLFPKLAGA
jgi:hypothetical protein